MPRRAPTLGPRYRLLEAIGSGGQGSVWRVEDLHQRGARRVLKAVPGGPGAGSALELAHEFERLAGLDHPALPRVRDLGVLEHDLGPLPAGTAYFTADEVEGVPLLIAIAGAPAAERARLLWSVAIDVAAALAHVHAAGLCHCDVTPANVLVVGAGDKARAVLIDLGLSAVRGALGAARGTLAYMAPEALAGAIDPRADLWGLGATLHHAVRGAPPFGAGDPAAVVRAIVRSSAPALDPIEAPGLAALIARLLARSPDERPASALAVFDELADAAAALPRPARPRPRPSVRPALIAPPVRGADPLLAELAGALEACRAGRAAGALLVTGPAGADVGGVVAHAVRRHQLDAAVAGAPPARILDGTLDVIAAALGASAGGAGPLGDDGARAASVQVIRAAAAQARTATVVDLTADERAGFVVAALTALAGPGLVIALVEGDPPTVPAGVRVLRRDPIGAPELAAMAGAMLGRPVPRSWAQALARASGGLPAVAAAIVTGLAAEGDPLAADPERDAAGASLDEIQLRQIGARGAAARAVAEVLAAWDGRAQPSWLAAVIDVAELELAVPATTTVVAWAGGGLAALVELGLVRRAGDEVAMRPGLAERVRASTPTARLQTWHTAAVAVARRLALPPVAWAAHLIALVPRLEHVAPLCAAAEERLRRGQPRAALALATAAARVPGPDGARAALIAARAAMTAGAYQPAIASAERAAADLGDPPAARLVLARARQRAGDLAGAEALLVELANERADDAEVAGALARLLVAAGRYAEAEGVVAAAEPWPPTAGGALCAEAGGTARLYRGDPAGADQRFVEAEAIAQATGDLALAGRARALRGMAAQVGGDLARASELYREAAAGSRAGGDVHAAAIAELNHGTTLAERGRHGEALPVLAAATAELAALGKVAELAAAELNRGLSLLAVGQVDAADDAARAARAEADPDRSPHLAVFALLLTGDVARRQGDRAAAAAAYRDAAELAATAGLADRGHALRGLAEVLAETDPAAAARALAGAAALDTSDDDRDRTLVTRGRVALAQPGPGDQGPLGDALAALADRALAEDRRDRAWRAAYLAAALADAAGARDLAAARARRAHGHLGELEAETPTAWRAGIATDPEAQALATLFAGGEPAARESAAPAARPGRAGTAPPAEEAPRLRRLLALSRRLNAEPSLERLLDEVIDTAIELTQGERGFLLLARGPTAALEVVVARGFADGALADPAAVSRSIAARAVATCEPVITVDAGVDERFGAAASVAALRLRSVVAVPLRQKGRVTGCLYIDHRMRASAFDDEAAALVLELADIAAVAIENASLTTDLRRQAAAIDELNQRLAATLTDREAELAIVRAKLPPTRDRLGPGLAGIVGDSPAVLAMLAVVQRAAQVALPVVIAGESGTGKELVARALHEAGPRRDRPFVAVNCGAMPEPLLESELFGHVRGAFTGADRDRKGLFEIADGGTLFLDEIADTGPAMQAKLLRVLQDGVVRRVGDERTRKVEVRVVAATQRTLTELAAAGRFRDDLRFRLEVITIAVPPLRARTEDLPALVEHLLARLRPEHPPSLTRAAWRALTAHGWPGNVRELENALARAIALGGDVIDADDLPEAIAARPVVATAPTPGDDLRLRPALERIERAYIAAALDKAGGNQTVAARLLGLSRFGLQKKLRRQAGEADDAE